ncbi:hypothetical protein ACJMK2_025628, partial [Sinanodonta woodiana]
MAKHTTDISRVWLYLTLFVNLVNLAAVITLSITYVRLSQDIEQNTIWKTTSKNVILNDLKEMLKSMWPLEPESRNRHLRQSSGNELAEMFNQIAKSEVKKENQVYLAYQDPAAYRVWQGLPVLQELKVRTY